MKQNILLFICQCENPIHIETEKELFIKSLSNPLAEIEYNPNAEMIVICDNCKGLI